MTKFQFSNFDPLPILATVVVVFLASCSSGSSSNDNPGSSAKFQQYYVQGEQLYNQHCSNCHQKNGTGLGLIYPPVNKSDFMEEKFEDVICLIKFGKQGEITVNGDSFVQAMPGVPTLTDLEVAEIATYIYNTWEHKRGIIEIKEVTQILNSCNKESISK